MECTDYKYNISDFLKLVLSKTTIDNKNDNESIVINSTKLFNLRPNPKSSRKQSQRLKLVIQSYLITL